MQERTEKPSLRTLRRAKERGAIPKSSEFASSVIVLGSLILIWGFSSLLYQKFCSAFITLYTHLNDHDLESIFQRAFFPLVLPLLLLLVGIFMFVLLGHLIQAGWVWQFKQVRQGGGSSLFFQMTFPVLKLSLSLFLGYWLLRHQRISFSLFFAAPEVQFFFILKKIFSLLVIVSGLQLVLGVCDFFYQKWIHYKRLHMTRQQQKEERREVEGDLTLKSKMRRR